MARGWRIIASGIVGFVITGGTANAVSQTVEGVVRDSVTSEPAEGVLMILVDSLERQTATDLTGGNGRYRLRAAREGTHSIEALRIGFEKWTSEPFVLTRGRAFRFDIDVPARRVVLEAITVEGESRCSLESGGADMLAVWDQVRNALNSTRLTIEDRLYRFSTEINDRRTDRDGNVISDETRTNMGNTSWPFQTVNPERLEDSGFVQGLSNLNPTYMGPDASLLVHESFLRTHCFTLVRGHLDEQQVIGLRFEPADDRRLPDIAGVLWLREDNAELIQLDYDFTNVPDWVRTANGQKIFDRLPNGAWYIREWRLSAPIPEVFNGRVVRIQGEWERVGRVRTVANRRGERILNFVVADSTESATDGP